MPRLAFVTDRHHPNLAADDRLVLPHLAAQGVTVSPAIWDDPDVDWASFDAAVVRSCWDYYHRPDAFLAWIDRVAAQTRLWNSPQLLRWNTEKRYLADLDARGISVVPTLRVAAGEVPDWAALRQSMGPELVVKPEVSANGYLTFRVNPDNIAPVSAAMRDAARCFLVQPFLPSVQTEGEWSLIFLGDAYSHAVRKVPAPTGFLVQDDHGGQSCFEPAPAGLVGWAASVLAAVGAPTRYARVDALRDGDAWRLVELELIEPSLFLAGHPDAPARFAAALTAF